MKIIWRRNYDRSNHTINVQSASSFLKSPIDSEQAKQKKLNIYVNTRMHYVIGREEIRFLFLQVACIPLYVSDDQLPEYVYQVDVLVGEKVYRAQLSKSEYSNEKWLGELGTREILTIPRTKYQRIISEIEPKNTNAIFFKSIGVHKANCQYYYVGSDCAISKDGRCDDILALQDGFNLGYEDNRNRVEIAEKVMRYNSMNLRVFYPFHCLAVMSVLNYFLNEMGKRAGMILWVDGEVASGKTELAIALGNFFDRGSSRSSMTNHLHTTKIRHKNAEAELIRCQNSIFVVDDVKKEDNHQNKETVRWVIDKVVRAVYLGMTDSGSVNANAIITGEYFKEAESTISRLIYLNIGGFLQNEENSKALRCIQEDRRYFNQFMCSFIAWILRKTGDESYRTELDDKLTKSHIEAERRIYDFQKSLRPRMIELCALLLFSTNIIKDYLCDSLEERNNLKIQSFYEKCKEAVIEIVIETWIRSLHYQPIFEMAFNNIIRDLKIKDCRYGESFLNAEEDISYIYATLRDNNRKSYTERVSRKEKLWLLKLDQECAGILINQGEEDILLMNKEIICTEIRNEIKANKDNWHMVYYDSDYTDEKILIGLLNARKLLAHKRSDGAFDKIINYPLIDYDDDSGEIGIFNKKAVQMVRVYIDDEKKILDYFKGFKKAEVSDWVNVRNKIRRNRGGGVEDVELNKVLSDLNKFSDLKQH